MKVSTLAKKLGLCYMTAWEMWRRGQLNAYQLPTGTIVVDDENPVKLSKPRPRGFARVKKSNSRRGRKHAVR